jgi:hypothetical protein
MMPLINRLLLIAAPAVAVIAIVLAVPYEQYLFRPFSSFQQEDDHIDTLIPSLFSMADIHGDYPKALAALLNAGVVDEQGDWTAGNATFVRTRALPKLDMN